MVPPGAKERMLRSGGKGFWTPNIQAIFEHTYHTVNVRYSTAIQRLDEGTSSHI